MFTPQDLIDAVQRYKSAKERVAYIKKEHADGCASIDEVGRVESTCNDCWNEVVHVLGQRIEWSGKDA